jgi:hypothetical protein
MLPDKTISTNKKNHQSHRIIRADPIKSSSTPLHEIIINPLFLRMPNFLSPLQKQHSSADEPNESSADLRAASSSSARARGAGRAGRRRRGGRARSESAARIGGRLSSGASIRGARVGGGGGVVGGSSRRRLGGGRGLGRLGGGGAGDGGGLGYVGVDGEGGGVVEQGWVVVVDDLERVVVALDDRGVRGPFEGAGVGEAA